MSKRKKIAPIKDRPVVVIEEGKGFAVVITRGDGTEFFSSSGSGIMPAIFPQRAYAVGLKRGLATHQMKGRVVRVRFRAISEVRPEAVDVFCKPCGSWHPKPRDKKHHKALQCFAPFKGKETKR